MTDQQSPQSYEKLPSSSTPETTNTNTNHSGQRVRYQSPREVTEGKKFRYPNPPDVTNPDPATLREQWRFAIKQYSRWYSQAWGTAILAGLSFFALGWIIKGSNPLPSYKGDSNASPDADTDGESHNAK